MTISTEIISNLIHNEKFTRKVLPYIKEEFFETDYEQALFTSIEEFVNKYGSVPTKETLILELENSTHIREDVYESCVKYVNDIQYTEKDFQWLLDSTENYCLNRSIYLAMIRSLSIIDGEDKEFDKGAIPQILQDALAVSFDTNIGHDYLEDYEARFDHYNDEAERLPFDIDELNTITRGGIPSKTLNIVLAGTNVGKTMVLAHFAANYLMQGKNVLYVTLEIGEEEIAERIDANLLNMSTDNFRKITKEQYSTKMQRIKMKTGGKVIVKQYPSASVNANHIRYLLNELKIKKNFVPHVIFVDYINLMNSVRFKAGSATNSYTTVKAAAEEIRGIGVEFDLRVWSATQLTRSGFANSDPGLEDTAESFGLPATADFMFALVSTPQLDELQQIMFKQLKTRYNNSKKNGKFVLGVDIDKQRLFSVQQPEYLADSDKSVMDNSTFGERANEDDSMKYVTKKAGRKDFSTLFGG